MEKKKSQLSYINWSSFLKQNCQTFASSSFLLIIYDSQWIVFGFWTIGWIKEGLWNDILGESNAHFYKMKFDIDETINESNPENDLQINWWEQLLVASLATCSL